MCNVYFQMDMKEEDDDDIGVGMARGMLDHSRMALCLFMLAVVTFNPFGVVLKRYTNPMSDYSATVVDGRTLQHVEGSTKRS
jgi:sterol regulatory element-binding transcription factor 1